MSIFYTNNIKEVNGFNSSSNQLAILKRKIPKDADLFFKKIMKSSLGIAGDVYKKTATNDIDQISNELFWIRTKKNKIKAPIIAEYNKNFNWSLL